MITKYRAYSKKTKKMYNSVVGLYAKNQNDIWCTVERNCPIEHKTVHHQIQPKDCVVMQSLGLHDRNKNEVFDGDILKYDDEYDKSIFKIVKNKFGWGVYYKGWSEEDDVKNRLTTLDNFHLENAFIVGNVFENPEFGFSQSLNRVFN